MNKNLKEIEQEIKHYKPSKALQSVMIQLGKIGFSFSGHGTMLSTGEEDFSLFKSYGENRRLNISVWLTSKNKAYICYQIGDSEITVNYLG